MEKTTLYLPPELQEALKQHSRVSGRSQADLIREALDLFLSKRPQPKPRSVAMGRDSELSARDSEAWLEQNWQR